MAKIDPKIAKKEQESKLQMAVDTALNELAKAIKKHREVSGDFTVVKPNLKEDNIAFTYVHTHPDKTTSTIELVASVVKAK